MGYMGGNSRHGKQSGTKLAIIIWNHYSSTTCLIRTAKPDRSHERSGFLRLDLEVGGKSAGELAFLGAAKPFELLVDVLHMANEVLTP